jgi:hypothetical protein
MKKRDIFVIVGVIVVALISLLVIELTKEKGANVVVSINGNEVATYSLAKDGLYELNNGTNILCIEDGTAYLIEASCPDHLCVKQGKISYQGETITCLPYKLTVTVIGGNAPSIDLES